MGTEAVCRARSPWAGSAGGAARASTLLGIVGALAALALSGWGAELPGQAVSSGVIRGTVRAVDGRDLDGAWVVVTHRGTGHRVATSVHHGRFSIHGLEVGGPYTVTVTHPAHHDVREDGLLLRLGAPLEFTVLLEPMTFALETLEVTVPRSLHTHGGTVAAVGDSLMHRLPSLDRDLYDFVRLVPQVSTKVGFRWGFSGAGGGIRFNNFLINGVPERSLVNATSALSGGRSIPLDAVREYQVLIAPYDVRYGDFTGALVNSVTRSGMNRTEGSAFVFVRNDRLARSPGDSSVAYERAQYGLSLGGPLRRDRAHYFVAVELQRLTSPAPGPYVGQSDASPTPVPVRDADLERLQGILRRHGLEAGSGTAVENRTPLTNVFGRVDVSIPRWAGRAVAWANYDGSSTDLFSRNVSTFPLSTAKIAMKRDNWLFATQLHTPLSRPGGGHNDVLLSYRFADFRVVAPVRQPWVTVLVPRAVGGGRVAINTGTAVRAQGGSASRFWNANLAEHLTLPMGAAHTVTLGAAVELFGSTPSPDVAGAFGAWTFPGLDALERGQADRYVVRRDVAGTNIASHGTQVAAYLSDEWRIGDDVSATLGLRWDVLTFGDAPPYNRAVDSIFGRRTDELPGARLHWSPRVGFTWNVSGGGVHRVRGGAGIFTGRPPPLWLREAQLSHGTGIAELHCGPLPTDRGLPPPFEADPDRAPQACRTGAALTEAPMGVVDLLAPGLRQARTLRASIGYDRQLPWGLLATAEVVLGWHLSDFEFVNLNLGEAQGLDRHGRVLYGAIGEDGIGRPARRSTFPQVVELRNNGRNHARQLSASLERRFADGASLLASYTHSRVRDVQTPLRTAVPGADNWAARAVSGRHDDPRPGISLNDIPHRVVVAGTYRAPWGRWSPEIAFYWVGESGSPFTYTAGGVGSLRGDLNADGSNTNDPIYVPRSAFDTREIRFEGDAADVASQQVTFEALVQRTPCLRRQRGGHLQRNSCREPWTNTTVALVRQPIPVRARTLEVELQAFNVLNVLRRSWGRQRAAQPALLEHVGHTAGAPSESQPIFRFTPSRSEWTTLPESRFQLQLALRYRF